MFRRSEIKGLPLPIADRGAQRGPGVQEGGAHEQPAAHVQEPAPQAASRGRHRRRHRPVLALWPRPGRVQWPPGDGLVVLVTVGRLNARTTS